MNREPEDVMPVLAVKDLVAVTKGILVSGSPDAPASEQSDSWLGLYDVR